MDNLLITGGTLWKGEGFASGEALFIAGGVIAASGPEEAVRRSAPSSCRLLKLSGESVLPGITDGHIHLAAWAKQRTLLDLSAAASLAEALAMVSAEADRLPSERWVRGWGYNDTRWPEGRSITRQDLDGLGIPNPVLLQRICTHINIADSKALALSGLESGDGILEERDAIPALEAMERNVFSRREVKKALKEALFELASRGVTCAHPCGADDYGMEEDLSIYSELKGENALPLRIFTYHDRQAHPPLPSGFGDGWVNYQGLKIYLDGSLGGRTAALSAPYADDKSEEGRLNWTDGKVLRLLREARERGVQTMLHAIGDRALDQALRCVGQVYEELGRPSLPDRINHVMVARPDQRRRLAELGVYCDIQPAFVPSDMNMAENRLGEDRLPWAYSWKSLLDEGLVMAASSDAPVESVNPQESIAHLMERSGPQGVFRPEERLSLEEAMPLFTSNPWKMIGRESFSGRLESGCAADVVVLDRDISPGDAQAVREARPKLVFAGGVLTAGELDGRAGMGA
ncbi:MAG: amidohydrolase [Synergistaceae bacterium]|nr:amidohydrolase [Synergistaceae bacterium]